MHCFGLRIINFTFFSLVFFLLSTLTPTLGMILPELAIVSKELHNNHYSVSAYYLAKVIVDLPLLLLGPLLYTAIVTPMTGIMGSVRTAAGFYVAIISHVIATYGWTIMLCCVIPDIKVAPPRTSRASVSTPYMPTLPCATLRRD